MITDEVIDAAFAKLRKKKTKRPEIIAIEKDYQAQREKIRRLIINIIPELSDGGEEFYPKPCEPTIIFEHGKRRKIFKPDIQEQWVHHIIIQVLSPAILKDSYKVSCGSIPKRGPHYGKQFIEKWIKDAKTTRYCLKFDIRHFYDSIRHDVLYKELERIVKDSWLILVIKRCLIHFKRGLPLGYYISQWLANFLLAGIDRLICTVTDKYIRYMDDGAAFSSNKRKLQKLITALKIKLGRMRLRIKDNYQIFRIAYTGKDGKTNGRDLDIMGFRFNRRHTILRKSIMISISRKARSFIKGRRWREKDIRAMLSYMGWIKHSQSYGFYLKYVKPYVKIKKLKQIVSKLDKRRKAHDGLDKRILLQATA